MGALRQTEIEFISEAEYFELAEKSEVRLEFIGGQIVAMAGGSLRHSRLFTRFATALNNRLTDSSCEASTADTRVRVEATREDFYPDVVVCCDDARFEARRPDTLLTPIVLIEVLSPSTALRDRTTKLDAYRQIPSLRHYLLVDQTRVRIEHHRRVEAGWQFDVYLWRAQNIPFEDLNIAVPVGEIYRRLDVPEGFLLVAEDNPPET